MLPFTDWILQEAYYYWLGKKAGRTVPARADLDPVEIPKLLPYVMLTDVLGPGNYRYRLVGTECVRGQGGDFTGVLVQEALKNGGYMSYVLGLYDECVRGFRPVYSDCLFRSLAGGTIERNVKALYMPLSNDGKAVNMIFVLQRIFTLDAASSGRHFTDNRTHKEIAYAVL